MLAITLDRVVAKVNSEIITLSEVESRVAVVSSRNKSDSSGKQLTKRELMKSTLDHIIDKKLQIQEAEKIGLQVDETTIQKA